jgi:hypothetical protein
MEDALICLAESGAQRGAEMPKFNLIKNAKSSFWVEEKFVLIKKKN